MKKRKPHSSISSQKNTPFLALLVLLCTFFAWPTEASAKPLQIGVASMVTPVSAVRYYQQIIDYLAEKLTMDVEMVHRTTYDEIDQMLEQRQVDVAFICSAPYVNDKKAFGIELLVAPMINGKTSYRSNIIVHRDSNLTAVEDLAHKTFAFVDPKSNSGRLYPTYFLAKKGLTPDIFFSRYFFSYSHNKSVEMVAKKKAAGAAVDSVVYAYMLAENSPYAKQTKIIHQSPEFGIPPVVVSPGISLFLKSKLKEVFLGMHLDAQGKTILSAMRIDRFVDVPDTNYDMIREMTDFLNKNQPTPQRTDDTPPPPDHKNEIFHFGVIPKDNPRIAYEKYQPLLDYLTIETGLRLELHLKNTYEATVTALGVGELDFALLGSLSYLDAYNRFGTPPIAKSTTKEGKPFYYSVIVVPPESSIATVSELTNKKVAFASLWSASGNLIPRYMLAWAGIHLDKLLEYNNFNYHETVVKKVLSHEYDAGGIRQSVAKKYLRFGLKTIATSDPIPTGPIVVSPNISSKVANKVKSALLAMNTTAEGRQVLQKLDSDLQGGFIPATDADYGTIRKMINDVPTGCGISCHPKTTF